MDRLSTISSLSFDRYIELCTDIPFIESLTNMLGISKSKAMVFMTSYVFKYFLSEVMSPGVRTQEDFYMINEAESLISSIGNSVTFRNNLEQYIRSFSTWKEFDKPRAATPFINKYKTLRTIRDTDNHHYYKKELKILIDMTYLQLITMISSIGGETALGRIDNDPDLTPDTIDNTLIDEFISSAKETFWSTFREELPNYNKVIILLRDFAERYRLIIPNRVDLLERMGEVLDIEFISQRLDSQSIGIESLIQYMDYIVLKTKEVDMPSEDENTDTWFTNLKTSHLSLSDPVYFLQNFFDYIFNRLHNIRNISLEYTPTIRRLYNERNEQMAE